jgi:two-component system nitrate/nitrite sensor histidine kinase NarX
MEKELRSNAFQDLRRYLNAKVRPAPGWHRKSPGVFDIRFLSSLGLLAISLIGLAITTFMLMKSTNLPQSPLYLHIGLMIFAFLQVIFMLFMTQRYLWKPLTHVRNWALRIRSGNLDARIPKLAEGEISKLARDINALADNFQTLSSKMDQRVKEQTEELARTNRSLEVLYDVAATLNMPKDLKSLLNEFMKIIRDTVDAKAVAVRLITDDGDMELVASMGLSDEIMAAERHMPMDCSVCGMSVQRGEISKASGLTQCQNILGQPLFPMPRLSMVSIPLQYRGETLGIYNLFMDPPGIEDNVDMENLLRTIGHHLGMVIGKARLDREARRKIIMEERSMLANELHDSLAQTLASLRFQVRVLDESLQQTGGLKIIRELEQVENSLEEAYADLRQLIAHCREPDVEKGLVPSIEKLMTRFRKETGINVFLQKEWGLSNLPPDYEMQVLRIIQEALSNIRKHSNAHLVRILLRCDNDGNHHILIENDGDGFEIPASSDHPGEHIGLTIMEERARHLNGTLRIESEPGEGTRVEVTFHYDSNTQMENKSLIKELGR